MALRMIQGGRRAPPAGQPTKSKKRWRKHHYADLLWEAASKNFYRNRAATVEELAARMTRLSKQILKTHVKVSVSEVERVISVVRWQSANYGWILAYVGYPSGYVTELVEQNSDGTWLRLLDDQDHKYLRAGFRKAVRTASTYLARTAVMAGALDSEDEELVDLVEECRLSARRLDRRIKKLEANGTDGW